MSTIDTGGGFSTREKWGFGLAGAGALLPALFGGSDSGLGQTEKQLQSLTDLSTSNAKSADQNGADLFAQIMPYLKAVSGGDRQAILGATMPERKRVIDQYATARKAIAEFSPRSGGTAASMNELQGNEASDLSMIGANARTQGVAQAGSLAQTLASLGLSERGQAMSGLNSIAGIQQARQQSAQAGAGQFGQALGLMSGFLFA